MDLNECTKHETIALLSSRLTSEITAEIELDSVPFADEKSEVTVIYRGRENVDIFAAYRDSSFVMKVRYGAGSAPSSIAVGDFNNDTR